MQHCVLCQKEFKSIRLTKKYCSQQCIRKAYKLRNPEKDRENRQNQSKRKWKRRYTDPLPKRCAQCGLLFTPHRRTPQQPYCSSECRLVAYRRNNASRIADWNRTERQRNRDRIAAYNARYKDQLRYSGNGLRTLQRDQYTCQSCGYVAPEQTEDRSQDVVVHHLDFSGQSLHPNNRVENLQTLCRPCHIRLHTHKVIHRF